MSLIGRAARSMTLDGLFQGWQSNLSSPAEWGLNYGPGSNVSFAGMAITPERAMTFSAVFACVRLISDTVSSLPVDVLQKYPVGQYGRPTPDWMKMPNPEMTWQTFIQQLVTARLMNGNAYFIPTTVRAKVAEVWPVDPWVVDTIRDRDTNDLAYLIRQRQVLTPRQITHIRGLTLPGYDKGLSPIECARHTVGLALSAEKHGSKLFSQGTAFDTVIKAKTKLKPEDAKALAKGFMLAHQGGENAFMPAIIDQDADIEHFSMTNEEAQFLATRQFQVEEVARWYGVPPVKIAMTEKATSWGTGIEQQGIAFLQECITPILVSLEAALTPLVKYENPDYYVKFNVSGLMRGDMAARKDYYKALWEVGAYSPDDILALEDMNPLPNGAGKEHYVPLNFAPIGAPVPPAGGAQ